MNSVLDENEVANALLYLSGLATENAKGLNQRQESWKHQPQKVMKRWSTIRALVYHEK